MRILALLLSIAFLYSCSSKNKILKKDNLAHHSKKTDSNCPHVNHYIESFPYLGVGSEGENLNYGIDIFPFMSKVDGRDSLTYYVDGENFGVKVNICEFLLSNYGNDHKKITLMQKSVPEYDSPLKIRPTEEMAMLGAYGCGPGLYFDNRESGEKKLLKTFISDRGNNDKSETYIPVAMAMHCEYDYPPNSIITPTPTYYKITSEIKENIICLINDGHIYTGTDDDLSDVNSRYDTFKILKSLKLCKDPNDRNSCKLVTTMCDDR